MKKISMPFFHLNIEIEFDFQLVGITCHEKDYRLAWALNRAMQWGFEKCDDIITDTSGTAFPRFVYRCQEDETVHWLCANRSGIDFLVPEIPHYDYLLKIENMGEESGDDFYRELRTVPLVIAAYPIIVDKLKSKQNLVWS